MPRRSGIRVRVSASSVVVTLVVLAGCTRTGGQTATPPHSPAGCVVRESSRAPLVVDGDREMYIEPTVVLPSGDRILLAGRPNYLFARDRSPAHPGITQDSVFGAVLDARGRPTLVPAPIEAALVAYTRAIAIEGGWAMVFGELSQPWQPPRPDTTVRLWYGEFDGRRWGRLEELPAIPDGMVNLQHGSELLRRGDTLLLGMPARVDSLTPQGIALFTRAAGQWKVELIRVRAAYVQLLHSESLGVLLAAVQPDRTFRQDVNSLILYGPGPGWERLRSVARGGSRPVHNPRFMASSSGVVASWSVDDLTTTPMTRRLRIMDGISESAGGIAVELDPDIQYYAPVVGSTRFPLWITEHNTITGEREIRFLADSGKTGVVLGSFPSPFTGVFAAAAVDASDILVSGPLFQPDSARPRLVSLLIRARVECRRSAP